MPPATADRRWVPPLREIREAKGLRQNHTAKDARMDPGHLSRVERGRVGMSVRVLHRLAAVLDLGELEQMLRPFVEPE